MDFAERTAAPALSTRPARFNLYNIGSEGLKVNKKMIFLISPETNAC